MTDATTADILAAWQLIEEHGLAIYPQRDMADATIRGWWCEMGLDAVQSWPIAGNPVDAVKTWAEAAGVPWPEVRVVPMWAVVDERGIMAISERNEDAVKSTVFWRTGRVVPCEVVIRNENEGV